MSTGLSQKSAFARWNHPSVDEYRRIIQSNNDGSQPLEPYQRVPQSVFESWMRDVCNNDPLIDLRYGYKVESVKETAQGIEAYVTENEGDEPQLYNAKYAVACDGASSRCRRSLGIGLDGGPT